MNSMTATTTNGPLIRRLRTDAGLTTRQLGAIVNVHSSTISRVERGQTGQASPFMVERIADHLGVPAGALYLPPRIDV